MKRRDAFRLLTPFLGVILVLTFPHAAREGCLEGLRLCGTVLVPALLPMSVLSGCLIEGGLGAWAEGLFGGWMETCFGLSGACAAPVLIGLVGGFPLGPAMLVRMAERGEISKAEGERLLPLCNNAGPAFLVGAVGTALGEPKLGWVIFGIQAVSALLTGRLMAPRNAAERGRIGGRKDTKKAAARKRVVTDGKRRPGNEQRESNAAPSQTAASAPHSLAVILPKALGNSALSMVRLTGTVVFFSGVKRALFQALPLEALPLLCRAALSGFLELTGSVEALPLLIIDQALPLAAALVGWGGVCVHLQVLETLGTADIRTGPYFLGKGVQSLLCLAMALGLQSLKGCGLPWLRRFFLVGGLLWSFLLFLRIFRKFSVGNQRRMWYNGDNL